MTRRVSAAAAAGGELRRVRPQGGSPARYKRSLPSPPPARAGVRGAPTTSRAPPSSALLLSARELLCVLQPARACVCTYVLHDAARGKERDDAGPSAAASDFFCSLFGSGDFPGYGDGVFLFYPRGGAQVKRGARCFQGCG